MTQNEKNDTAAAAGGSEPGEEILQEYTKTFWQNSKFWLWVVLLLIIAGFCLGVQENRDEHVHDPRRIEGGGGVFRYFQPVEGQ